MKRVLQIGYAGGLSEQNSSLDVNFGTDDGISLGPQKGGEEYWVKFTNSRKQTFHLNIIVNRIERDELGFPQAIIDVEIFDGLRETILKKYMFSLKAERHIFDELSG